MKIYGRRGLSIYTAGHGGNRTGEGRQRRTRGWWELLRPDSEETTLRNLRRLRDYLRGQKPQWRSPHNRPKGWRLYPKNKRHVGHKNMAESDSQVVSFVFLFCNILYYFKMLFQSSSRPAGVVCLINWPRSLGGDLHERRGWRPWNRQHLRESGLVHNESVSISDCITAGDRKWAPTDLPNKFGRAYDEHKGHKASERMWRGGTKTETGEGKCSDS